MPIVLGEVRLNGRCIKTYIMLDICSEITMVTGRLAERAGLHGPKEKTSIGTVNSRAQPQTAMRVSFKLASTTEDVVFEIEEGIVISSLVLSKRSVNLKKLKEDWPHLATVPLEAPTAEDVGILIGMDNPALYEIYAQTVDPH